MFVDTQVDGCKNLCGNDNPELNYTSFLYDEQVVASAYTNVSNQVSDSTICHEFFP